MESVSSLSSLTIKFHIIETVKAMDVHSECDIKVRVRYQLAQNKQLTHHIWHLQMCPAVSALISGQLQLSTLMLHYPDPTLKC